MYLFSRKWLAASPFFILAIAVSSSAWAGANINLRNHVAVAREVNQLIDQELKENGQSFAEVVSDEIFIRRVTLDLAGRIPSVSELTLFGLDPDPQKRDKLIQKLIASDDFSANWSAYWRDVIYSRATDTRSARFQGVFESWLKEKFAANRPWDEIATEIITATGDVQKNGATALMFAHQGDAKEIAAEVSRVFMGIQIQCANCHDHPTDIWTREQFHELAAFFPRVRVRPLRDQTPRSFEVVSFNSSGRNPGNFLKNLNPQRMLRNFDSNNDGKISRNEVKKNPQFAKFFNRMVRVADQDGDKALSAKELKELPKLAGNNNRGAAEYFMADLENPSARGTLMQPVFFVNESKATEGLLDVERRVQAAKYVTSAENPWFAKAFVNRIWAEMLGQGFYSPVDDIGPLRDPDHEQAITLLSEAFIANNYDIKWLYRTIANTSAYQRNGSMPSSDQQIGEPIAFAVATPTRLRSEQIFASLMELSGIEQNQSNAVAGQRRNRNNTKRQFTTLFGYDPSTPQDDLMGTIPQSLFMMNSRVIEQLISARGTSPLARIVQKYNDDQDALHELYLLVLSRDPSQNELRTCQDYVKQTDDRNEAFEDIMWSLVNSSEFISKR